MKEFIYLFLGGQDSDDMNTEKQEQQQDAWDEWMDKLDDLGVLIDGMPLEDEKVVMDGENVDRFTAKEMDNEVTGYLIIETESMNRAIELAQDCPIFDFNGRLEIRALVSDDSIEEEED